MFQPTATYIPPRHLRTTCTSWSGKCLKAVGSVIDIHVRALVTQDDPALVRSTSAMGQFVAKLWQLFGLLPFQSQFHRLFGCRVEVPRNASLQPSASSSSISSGA